VFIRRLISGYLDAFKGLPREAWLLSTAIFVNRSGSMILAFLTLYLTTKLHFTIQLAGLMLSLFGFGAMLGAIVGGWLTDKFGPFRVLVLTQALGGVSFVVLGYMTTVWQISGLLFLTGMLAEGYRPAHLTAMAQVCSAEQRVRGFALSRLAVNLGMSVGPSVGGFLAQLDYHLLFWVDGVTGLAAGMLIFFFFRDFKAVDSDGAENAMLFSGNASPWRDTIFLMLIIFMFIIGATFNQAFNTWPIFLKQFYLLNESSIGLMMGLNALIIVIFEMPVIHRLGHIHPLNMVSVGVLFFFSGFALIPFGESFGFVAFTVVLWTIGEMLIFPVIPGFVAQRATEKNRGKYMGIFSLGFGVSFSVGPIIGTWAYSTIGAVAMWYWVALLGLITLGGFRWIYYRLHGRIY
jgi:MFS family permease